MEILFTVFIMIICLIAEGFFSGSEIGVVSADRLKLREKAAKGSRGAKLALGMLEKPEWLLSTTLVGTNIAVVTNTTMATALMIALFGPSYSWLAVVLVAPLIWVFGEIVPKSIFQQKADEITPRAIFLLKFFSYLFYPILIVFSLLTRLLAKLVGGGKESNIFTLREQIISMLRLSEPQGDVHPHQGKMIRRMFHFSETEAAQIMVPLVDTVGVAKDARCDQVTRLSHESAHRFLVVYDDRIDRIIGVVHALDLLGKDSDSPITPYIRPARYVSGSKSAQHLLQELRQTNTAIAVVINEYGTARGIITAEDIMEEVVFDFEDEFDAELEPLQWVRKQAEQDYLVSGRIELDRLKDEVGIKIRKGNYATLAGYLLEKTHEVPPEGTVIESHGISYTVTSVQGHAIEEVGIRW
ncbi:MAG: HlyC/CorC family transporter [Gammaproteobacteria bacterium]|nr:HlyC/CorC family transporter [Gammaproteobacteria bacterium]